MTKKKNLGGLDAKVNRLIDRLHKLQIVLEIALVIILLSILTFRLSFGIPAYGMFLFFTLAVSSLAIFIVGILITFYAAKLKDASESPSKYHKRLSLLIILDWLFIPSFGVVYLMAHLIELPDTAIYVVVPMLSLATLLILLTLTSVAIHRLWRASIKKHSANFIRPGSYALLAVLVVAISIFGTYTTTEELAFKHTTISDSSLEIDQTETRQQGKNGEKQVVHNLVFGIPFSTNVIEPVDEIVAKGTTRYQYMYCSNDSYRYYTSEQMRDPGVGFTHRSEDYCAANGQGTQTALANVPPPQKQTTYVPTYTSPRSTITNCYSGIYNNSFSCYSY